MAWPLLIGVGGAGGCTAAGIGALSLADALTATGLPDPGPVTTWGCPSSGPPARSPRCWPSGRSCSRRSWFRRRSNGVLDADGYRALRVATVASGAWAVCAALLVPLTISDVSGQPFAAHLNPATLVAGRPDQHRVGVAMDGVAGRGGHAGQPAGAALVLDSPAAGRVVGHTIPLGLTGHASAGGSHDLATNSLLIHLVAASLWAGGLLALLSMPRRGGQHADLAARRFSAIALWCFVAMAVSGVVNALVRIPPSDLLTTDYGRLVVAKFVALCLLGVVGWRQRRSGVVALQADPGVANRFCAAGADRGAAFRRHVRHRRRPRPHASAAAADRLPSIPDAEIGYDFAGPPTLARMLFDWRFDLIFGTAAIVFAALYLAAVLPAAPPR